MTSLYWNLALDENGGPQLDGASSCEHEGGCTGLVEVKSDGTYVLRQQCGFSSLLFPLPRNRITTKSYPSYIPRRLRPRPALESYPPEGRWRPIRQAYRRQRYWRSELGPRCRSVPHGARRSQRAFALLIGRAEL